MYRQTCLQTMTSPHRHPAYERAQPEARPAVSAWSVGRHMRACYGPPTALTAAQDNEAYKASSPNLSRCVGSECDIICAGSKDRTAACGEHLFRQRQHRNNFGHDTVWESKSITGAPALAERVACLSGDMGRCYHPPQWKRHMSACPNQACASATNKHVQHLRAMCAWRCAHSMHWRTTWAAAPRKRCRHMEQRS